MKILILGNSGMLGEEVAKFFYAKKEYDVISTSRKKNDNLFPNTLFLDAKEFVDNKIFLPKVDFVINCIGVIPHKKHTTEEMYIVNQVFFKKLEEQCLTLGNKLIHVSSDCVFSGNKGNYIETDQADDISVYGVSKNNVGHCMTIRTSLIGKESNGKNNFLEWVIKNKNSSIDGYCNHIWNGITTLEFALLCDKIMKKGLYQNELFHIFSTTISKYDLCSLVNNVYELNINIKNVYAKKEINRTLSTIKPLNNILQIKDIEKMLYEYKKNEQ
jgi:dTDP-4-dehydrorhamnose reductase